MVQNEGEWREREVHRALAEEVARCEGILGIDCEWVPNSRRTPIATVQLAGRERVFIFQLGQMMADNTQQLIDGGCLETLDRTVFRDAGLLKVGVGVVQDCSRLQHAYERLRLKPRRRTFSGFVGTEGLIRDLFGFKDYTLGLRALAWDLLGFPMEEKGKGRKSRAQHYMWDRERLTGDQVRYAAADAWASRMTSISVAALALRQAAGRGGDAVGARDGSWFEGRRLSGEGALLCGDHVERQRSTGCSAEADSVESVRGFLAAYAAYKRALRRAPKRPKKDGAAERSPEEIRAALDAIPRGPVR